VLRKSEQGPNLLYINFQGDWIQERKHTNRKFSPTK